MSVWDEIEFFGQSEFYKPEEMTDDLLYKLDLARRVAGMSFVITDSFRDPDNTIGASKSAHYRGEAVDIRVENSTQRFLIVFGLIEAGFKRIGVYDKHVHADVGKQADGYDQQVMWMGVSK